MFVARDSPDLVDKEDDEDLDEDLEDDLERLLVFFPVDWICIFDFGPTFLFLPGISF